MKTYKQTGKRKQVGARARLRQYFLDNLGRTLSNDELREVGKISEWARRVRELREIEGFKILTHHDRDFLKVDEYLLEDPHPKPTFERTISKELRALVLDRNGFTCQMCGAVAGEPSPLDPSKKTRLHIGHILDKSKGGRDELSNLRALCSVCNEGAQNITPIRPDYLQLIVAIRRARIEDQLGALRWLARKFPEQTRSALDSPQE